MTAGSLKPIEVLVILTSSRNPGLDNVLEEVRRNHSHLEDVRATIHATLNDFVPVITSNTATRLRNILAGHFGEGLDAYVRFIDLSKHSEFALPSGRYPRPLIVVSGLEHALEKHLTALKTRCLRPSARVIYVSPTESYVGWEKFLSEHKRPDLLSHLTRIRSSFYTSRH